MHAYVAITFVNVLNVLEEEKDVLRSVVVGLVTYLSMLAHGTLIT
jgi:hypothetical protein